jgi:hypothetical protein
MTHVDRLPRFGLLIASTAVLLFAGAAAVAQSPASKCEDTGSNIGGSAAALRPSDVLLAITSPRAGEMVVEAMPSESVSVSVDFWGPRLLAAAAARKIDDYHLVFFLDIDDAGYLGTLMPTPRCNPKIQHTASTNVTFDHVTHGAHAVYVMLVGSNDISVNPPVAASTSFVSTVGS